MSTLSARKLTYQSCEVVPKFVIDIAEAFEQGKVIFGGRRVGRTWAAQIAMASPVSKLQNVRELMKIVKSEEQKQHIGFGLTRSTIELTEPELSERLEAIKTNRHHTTPIEPPIETVSTYPFAMLP